MMRQWAQTMRGCRLQAGSGDGQADGSGAAAEGSGGAALPAARQELLRGHEAAITDVIIAPDGRNIASAAADGVVRATNIQPLKTEPSSCLPILCSHACQGSKSLQSMPWRFFLCHDCC